MTHTVIRSPRLQFASLNEAHIKSKLKKGYVDPNWHAMLQEILSECDQGKMEGRLAAPDNWRTATITVDDRPLRPSPTYPIRASVYFSVEQHDKLRRCLGTMPRWVHLMLQFTMGWTTMFSYVVGEPPKDNGLVYGLTTWQQHTANYQLET